MLHPVLFSALAPCVSVSPVQRVSWNFLTASRTLLAEILSLFAHAIPLNTGQALWSGQQKLLCDFDSKAASFVRALLANFQANSDGSLSEAISEIGILLKEKYCKLMSAKRTL